MWGMQHYNNNTIVVWKGIIAEYGLLKNFTEKLTDVRLADYNEVQKYNTRP